MLAGPGLQDHWYAVGLADSRGRLDTRRVWLYGATSRRWALLLSFAPPGGFLDDLVPAGCRLHADPALYPGSGQYRALVGEQLDLIEPLIPPAEAYAACRTGSPRCWPPTRGRAGCRRWSAPSRSPRGSKGGPWRLREATGACRDVIDLPGEPWPCWRVHSPPRRIFGEWSPGDSGRSACCLMTMGLVQRGPGPTGGLNR